MPIPNAPTGLSLIQPAAVFRSTSVQLAFTDNSSDEDGFKIERKIGAGAFVEIAQIGPNAGSSANFFDKTGEVTPGSSVTYRVRAFNSSGDSAYSNEPSPVTLGSTAVPAAPTSPTATWGATGITVSFSHSEIGNWQCCGVTFANTQFQIWRSESPSGPFEEIGGSLNQGTYLDRQWEFNKTYYYKIRGWHYHGFGPFSSVTSGVSTPASATTPVASISAPATAYAGEVIVVSGSASTYVNDNPSVIGTAPNQVVQYPYIFDFGTGPLDDGEDIGYNLREAGYAYRTPGTKTITLTVKGPTGLTDTETHEIVVSEIPVSNDTPHSCTVGEDGAVVSAVHRPTTFATLQAAINASVVQNNPLIELTTGTDDYITTGALLLKSQRTGTGYCTIRPLNYTTNFTNQKRVTSADVNNLAKISLAAVNTYDDVIQVEGHDTNPAHHYRLQGIQVRKTSATETVTINAGFNLFPMGTSNSAPWTPLSLSKLPHHIILQHCYLDGDPKESHWAFGVSAYARQVSILDSRLVNIKRNGFESYGVYIMGPEVIIDNNELYAFSMAVFLTGEESAWSYNAIQRHVTTRRNNLTRRLADKTETYFTSGAFNWKNIFEVKRGEFIMLTRNVIGPSWAGAQDGTPILFTPANQTCDSPYTQIHHVQVKNNVVRSNNASGSSGTWIDLYARDGSCGGVADMSSHEFVTNNLFFDGAGGDYPQIFMFVGSDVGEFLKYIVSEHNTVLTTEDTISFGNGEWVHLLQSKINLIFANNVHLSGYVKGATDGFFGKAALDAYAKNYSFLGMTIEGGVGGHPSWSGLDASNKFPADIPAVGWTDYTNRDLRLSASSPYRAAGSDPATDGTDRGANLTTILNAVGGTSYSFGTGTSKAESGNWTPSGIIVCRWSTNPSCQ